MARKRLHHVVQRANIKRKSKQETWVDNIGLADGRQGWKCVFQTFQLEREGRTDEMQNGETDKASKKTCVYT